MAHTNLVLMAVLVCCVGIVGIQPNTVAAATVFIDTFNDNDLTNDQPVSAIDGTPIVWTPFGSAAADVQSGKLVVTAGPSGQGVGTAEFPTPRLNIVYARASEFDAAKVHYERAKEARERGEPVHFLDCVDHS